MPNGRTVAVGVLPALGEYDCVVLELPGWCPTGNANGLGDLVGDAGNGDGDGVLANGLNGICPTDFLRLGTFVGHDGLAACKLFEHELECNLCFKP